MPEQAKPEMEKTNSRTIPIKLPVALPKIALPKLSKNNLKILGAVILAGLLGSGVYYLRSYVVAATVNGKVIYRLKLLQELEKQGGKSVLDTMVTKELINQEAIKNNVVVTQEDLDNEIKQIEASTQSMGMTLDEALAKQNVSKAQLMEELTINKKLEKLVQDKITVTDTEVSDYMTQNKDSLPKGTDEATLKEQVKSSLSQQKLSQAVQDLITNLKQSAKINYYVTY